jgi:hypothetical protein
MARGRGLSLLVLREGMEWPTFAKAMFAITDTQIYCMYRMLYVQHLHKYQCLGRELSTAEASIREYRTKIQDLKCRMILERE